MSVKGVFFGRSELKDFAHMHYTIPRSSPQSKQGDYHVAHTPSLWAGDSSTEDTGHLTPDAACGGGASQVGTL